MSEVRKGGEEEVVGSFGGVCWGVASTGVAYAY